MANPRTDDLMALIRRLALHIDHGTPIAEDDLIVAAYEAHALAYLGMRTGSLGIYRNRRVKGPTTPLLQKAQCYIRAEALTQAVAGGMDTVIDWVRSNG